jgi:hypothetical protein
VIKHNNSSNARAFAATVVLQGALRNNMHIHRLSKAMTRKFMHAQTDEIMKLILNAAGRFDNFARMEKRTAWQTLILNNTTKIQLFL